MQPVIDVHTHVHPDQRLSEIQDDGRYRAEAAAAGVIHAVSLVIAPAGDIAGTRSLKDSCLAHASDSAGFFLPFCSVHPDDGPEALTEVARVARKGARGIKMHPNTQRFDVASPGVSAVVGEATKHGLPVLFDAFSPFDPAQPGKFLDLAVANPDARIVLAHAHGPSFPQLLSYAFLARYDWWRRNVWVDISATASLLTNGPFRDQFRWTLEQVGLDRILFGSDYPMYGPGESVEAAQALGLAEADLRRVLFQNASELLGL